MIFSTIFTIFYKARVMERVTVTPAQTAEVSVETPNTLEQMALVVYFFSCWDRRQEKKGVRSSWQRLNSLAVATCFHPGHWIRFPVGSSAQVKNVVWLTDWKKSGFMEQWDRPAPHTHAVLRGPGGDLFSSKVADCLVMNESRESGPSNVP